MSVNLYDPNTLQGSVWNEKDVGRKRAEGFLNEDEFKAIMAEKAAEERQEWLMSSDTVEERFRMLRNARDAKVAACDYFILPDYPADSTLKAAVEAYRQELRDLPSQEGAPWDGGGELTPWPTDPLAD